MILRENHLVNAGDVPVLYSYVVPSHGLGEHGSSVLASQREPKHLAVDFGRRRVRTLETHNSASVIRRTQMYILYFFKSSHWSIGAGLFVYLVMVIKLLFYL